MAPISAERGRQGRLAARDLGLWSDTRVLSDIGP
jgi:hypothetical protein